MATLSDDRLVREIKRFLSPAAQNYINMVQRTGKPKSILQQFEGLTTQQIRFLDQLMDNPSEFSGMDILREGLTKNDNPELLEGLNQVVAKGGEIPEPKLPYYNPVTSTVEMLTRDEARNVNAKPATQQQIAASEIDETKLAQIEFGAAPAPASDPNQPPVGPLPPGQQYVYDATAKAWSIVDSGGNRLGYVEPSGALISGTEATAAPARIPSEEGGVSDVAEEPADTNIPEDWRNAAREMYPQYYAIVRNIPEIAQLLEKAINESYTPEKFQAELEQTNWYLQTSGSAREWEMNSQRDPASAQRKIDEQIVIIRDLALSSFGVRLSDERLSQLAEDSLRFGWSNRFLQNAIGDVATTSTTGISQLREGYIGQQLRKTADDYGISVSDATFNQWVNKVAVGQESTATFQDYARVQAKNLFPSISDRIDAGETFQQIIDPYRESAASLLEIDGGTIDFKQPDWIKAVTYQDEKGQQRPMSFTEWNDYVRQNRSFGYEYTEQAQRRAYQVANSLANLFGKV